MHTESFKTAPGCGAATFSGPAALKECGDEARAIESARLALAPSAIAAFVVVLRGAGHGERFATQIATESARADYENALRQATYDSGEIDEFLADTSKPPQMAYLHPDDFATEKQRATA